MDDSPIIQQRLLPSSLLSLGDFSTWVSQICAFFLCDGHQELQGLPDWLLQCNQPWSCAPPGCHLLFAFLYFPPISCVLVASLSTWTALGHRQRRGWLSPVSHAPEMLSQTSSWQLRVTTRHNCVCDATPRLPGQTCNVWLGTSQAQILFMINNYWLNNPVRIPFCLLHVMWPLGNDWRVSNIEERSLIVKP